MRPIAIITGASAGFGRATAIALARNNYDVVITGRRSEKLETVEEAIRSKTDADVLSLTFDIRDKEAVKEACGKLTGKWEAIDVLVNNAGLAAGLSLIHEGDVDDWEQMIDTNIKGLLYITRQITPGMVKREKGHIINIGSIAGKEAYEMGNVYNASKFAVDGLTQAMRIDLVDYGIKVTAVNPGASETEFSLVRFKGDQEQADKVYEGFTPLYAEDIAEAVLFAVSRPPHVNIDDLVIMPTSQARSRKIIRKKT
ncbi:MAG: NAD(P)-dependent oxidoreductase [Bacteroidetes bacterium]|nr:MAG: NAD(P)-dependent oxidoreductase [Bacteroidota bacterium]RLD93927.1 MAG: NAD(P)-dependent oxidoreductase [Bacteroidota bacterium]RLD94509.1 MAG: NAD(P)-dependent oxidoreductase [Bacteroidota bacterium]